MSNEYEDDNTLAGLPTFASNPGQRSAPGKDASQAVRPPVWESATMADVREAIEAKARDLGVPRHEIVANTVNGSALDHALEDRFYGALATYHGQPDATAMRFDSKHEAVVAALNDLKAIDVAEPLTPAAAAEGALAPKPTATATEARPEPQAEGAAQAAPNDDMVNIPRAELEALRRAAEVVHAKQGAKPEVSPENIAEAAEAIRQGSKPAAGTAPGAAGPGVVKTNVGEAAAHMTQGALTAGASLIGGALKGTFGAVRKGIDAMRPDKEADAALAPVTPAPTSPGKARPMVLPRLSEYRVSQVEDQVNRYTVAQEAFWASGKMPDVRKAIEEKARESGLSVEDVMEKMKPGGEMHELHERYVDAYSNSPGAADHRKTMNKAIDGFVRQYGQAHEEMLAPEQQGADYFEGYKSRVEGAKDRMFKKAGHVPLLDGEDKTNLQKLQEAVAKIIEKVKEMVSGFTNMLRGKAGAETEAVSEPAP